MPSTPTCSSRRGGTRRRSTPSDWRCRITPGSTSRSSRTSGCASRACCSVAASSPRSSPTTASPSASIHRADHEQFSLFLTADKLPKLLAPIYDDPARTIIVAEASHAIISHRSKGAPFTIEAAILRVSDALDMAKGRSRADKLLPNIHSVSSKAIESVKILPGREKAVRIEIEMSNSAGIYQVDEGLGTKLRGTPLAEHLEVVARIDAEHEQRLVPVFRI
jgi:metal-dependent HD superfamily phosphatase/phosphodiesterase